MPQLLMDGSGHTFLGDLFVKIKNMGPIGDEIIERFKKKLPPDLQDNNMEIPPAVQAEMQKAQQVIDGLTEKVNAMHEVISSKTLEIQSEERRNEADNKTKIAIAEINAQVKENIHELQMSMDRIALDLNHQFEAMQGSLTHQRTLEQQQAGHEQALEQSEQAAALEPPPAEETTA